MRNAIYPSFTAHLCRHGGNEIQMPASDLSLNVCGSSFFNESQVCSDRHLGSFAPLSAMEIPQSFNALNLPGWSDDAASTIERTSQLNLSSRSLVLDREAVDTENVRKRKIKCESSEKKPSMEEFQKNKAVCTEVRRQNVYSLEKPSESREKKAPVKRSQKISDKITVLQKLVSPFGKTDTASVLQEAYSYIKYLQEQIEMLSAPYFTLRPLQSQCTPGSRVDLCSRGLTLVPVSFTQKLTKADHHDRSSSRRATFGRIY